METNITLTECIEVAKAQTKRSAEMKDWKIRNRKNRNMREVARNLVKITGGYIIATPSEISDAYGVNVGEGDKKYVWSISWNNTYKELQFTPIR